MGSIRLNMNLKSLTCEELLEQKKQMHVQNFVYLLDELRAVRSRAGFAVVSVCKCVCVFACVRACGFSCGRVRDTELEKLSPV